MLVVWISVFSVLGSVGAMAGAFTLILFPAAVRNRLLPALLSYAAGTLLGAAFLGMIPNAVDGASAARVSASVMFGIIGFFVLEKIIVWRHSHGADIDAKGQTGSLILVGDAFHNFVDGVLIAGAFMTSIPLGISASIAVIVHEIPQEVGDFAILLDSGYSKLRALL